MKTGLLSDLGVMQFVKSVCRRHHVTMDEFTNTTGVHEPRVVRARREAWLVTRDTLALGYAETARIFGVDHTSIITADRKRQAELQELFAPRRGADSLGG